MSTLVITDYKNTVQKLFKPMLCSYNKIHDLLLKKVNIEMLLKLNMDCSESFKLLHKHKLEI